MRLLFGTDGFRVQEFLGFKWFGESFVPSTKISVDGNDNSW